jgi:hypothetical protein
MSDAVQIVAVMVMGLVSLTLGVVAIVHGRNFTASAGLDGMDVDVKAEDRSDETRTATGSKRRKS